jgi:CheY-like chemotaxis protein
MVRRTILVVDDNEDSIFILKHFLKKLGYNIIIAKNGQEGIDKAFDEKPDLIIMDIMMPVLDGYEATRKIRLNEDFKKIPIIALTAHASIVDKSKTFASGCNDYLAKPIALNKLNSIIEKWLVN